MAVSAAPTRQSGGKKNLDAELNLVPFIDLLICCICFLLLTSVWVQMSHVEANLRGGGSGDQEAPVPRRLTILVGEEGYTLSLGPQNIRIPKRGQLYEESQLDQKLRVLGTEPSLRTAGLIISAEDGVAYKHLIRTMDLALGQGFRGITLSDGKGLL